jgi:hypothetical protein
MLFSKRLIGGPGSFFTVPVYRSGGLPLGVREKPRRPEDRYPTGDLPAVAARVHTDSHGSRNSRGPTMRQMSGTVELPPSAIPRLAGTRVAT